MKKGMTKFFFVAIFVGVLLSGFASAGWLGSFFGKTTGNAISSNSTICPTNYVPVCCFLNGKMVTATNACLCTSKGGNVSYTGVCKTNTTQSCKDSDGENIYAAGVVTYGSQIYRDSCANSHLREYTCDNFISYSYSGGLIPGTTVYSSNTDCPGACANNGSCAVVACKDSDGGINYNVKGSVVMGTNSYADDCLDNKVVREFVCNSSSLYRFNYIKFSCPGTCGNGTCLNITCPSTYVPVCCSLKGMNVTATNACLCTSKGGHVSYTGVCNLSASYADGVLLERATDMLEIGENISGVFGASLTKAHMYRFLAGGSYVSKNSSFPYEQKIVLGSNLKLKNFSSVNYNNAQWTVGFDLAPGTHILTYYLQFIVSLDSVVGTGANNCTVGRLCYVEGTSLPFMGEKYKVLSASKDYLKLQKTGGVLKTVEINSTSRQVKVNGFSSDSLSGEIVLGSSSLPGHVKIDRIAIKWVLSDRTYLTAKVPLNMPALGALGFNMTLVNANKDSDAKVYLNGFGASY